MTQFGPAVLIRLAVLLVLLGLTRSAVAHPAPFSFVDIRLDSGGMRGALVIHDFDVAHELKIGQAELLRDPAFAQKVRGPLVGLLDARMSFRADDSILKPKWGGIEVLAARQSLRLPFTLDGPAPAKLEVEARLFPYDASHQTFVNIYEQGQLGKQAIIDSERSSTSFFSGTPQGRWAVVRSFVQAGVHHILIGPDHVLFLVGLLLLGGTLWRLAAIVTAFTVGHSITLSLAALQVVRLSPAIVEPAIALTIIVVGVDALVVSRLQRPGAVAAGTKPPRDLRIWLAGGFGLIHGFGFAAVLIEFGLPREALLWSLAAFNIGVEIGQLLIVLLLIALTRGVQSLPFYRASAAQKFVPLASIAVVAAGLYWFVERTIFAPTA